MAGPDLPSLALAGTSLNLYATGRAAATLALRGLLEGRIAVEGPLAFGDFMAEALYHPEYGYYAREARQTGREGDFFTSVSVGPLFGRILARRFLRWHRTAGAPAPWRIHEIGAHDGQLAADILAEIQRLDPPAFAGLEYALAEPLPRLRAAQHRTLEAFHGKTLHAGTPEDLAEGPPPGIVFGNEVLDALPFHVVERRGGRWHECRVDAAPEGGFRWDTAAEVTDPATLAALQAIGGDFPEGYRTEIRPDFAGFLAPLLRTIREGLLLWPDYGFARPEYYHPERVTGTLRTFSRHRAGEDPLAEPGEVDITAHVDFTALAEAAEHLGARPAAFAPQGSWLTREARDWLISLEENPDPALLRQFQTLTHPAQLGAKFHVIELAWNDPSIPPLPAADGRRLGREEKEVPSEQ